MTVTALPALNAGLNATSAVFLLAGWGFIRIKRTGAHALMMMAALMASTLFLVSYLTYHVNVGSVRFAGTGWVRPLYFVILISHTVLAVVIVPLVIRTVFLAATKRYREHMVLARWTLPVWFYVSVSGMLVYWMLYRSPWAS